jgi:hypothetical protein
MPQSGKVKTIPRWSASALFPIKDLSLSRQN